MRHGIGGIRRHRAQELLIRQMKGGGHALVIVQRGEKVSAAEQAADNPLDAGDVLTYPNVGEPSCQRRCSGPAPYTLRLSIVSA